MHSSNRNPFSEDPGFRALEKGGSAGRGLYHERSKEVNLFQIYNMDSGNAMELGFHADPNESSFHGGSWKHIRTLEWNWKRDVTPVPSEMEQLTIESNFFHYFRIRNSAKGKPGSKLFKNSGVVEFLDPLT
ncbi:hypothetical protein PVK06_006329 [Gossypium arboreum]|uniref:Uncharacterized protein n=1 Tax=Gossypium arboreum TaxID=29729 RepID=A0ABR0QF72_GOSAR|nr:hypothetical protein PVK06_006329 [Gossypium arboreum]